MLFELSLIWGAMVEDASIWLAAHGVTGGDIYAATLAYWGVLRGAVIVCALLILASSLDDLIIDILYWTRALVRLVCFWNRPPKQARLDRHPEKLIAIMVPAWQEAEVIANMVANTSKTFDYTRYRIFVGVYANDPGTRREVEKVRQRFPNVYRAEVPHDGPTSKADCLNWIVQNILLHEEKTGERFDAFLMHDAEDVVHPYGLKTVNWFIDRAAMIQMPVLSMDRKWTSLVACHYMDEFAEFHTKDLPVRSALAAMTPSAGVATAFHRVAMMALLKEKNGQPFDSDSLTEDYEVAHQLSALGLPSEFVRYHARVPRQRKAWFRRGLVTYRRRELVATKEFFPDKFRTSVRQKARWMLGISIMGWKLGWFGDLVDRYYLFRDRKALITAPVGMFSYLVVAQVIGMLLITRVWPRAVDLPPIIDRHWVQLVIALNLLFLLNRVLHRVLFTFLNHGLKHVWLAPVRIVVSNIISFGAFWRAARQYLTFLVTRRPIAWDKTQHSYPSLSELQGQGRIGDTLRFWNYLDDAALDAALAAQARRYRPLGLALLDQGAVEDDHLAEAFAEQAGTYGSTFNPLKIKPQALRLLSREEAARFGAVPLRLREGVAGVALAEPLGPSAMAELERILGRAGARGVQFLFAPLSDIAFSVRFAWADSPFGAMPERLNQMRADGQIDAQGESRMWRSIRAGYVRLGDLLVRDGALTHEDLQSALAVSRRSGRRLGETLVASGLVPQARLDAALTAQHGPIWVRAALAEAMKQTADHAQAS